MPQVADKDLTSTFRIRDVSEEFTLARKEEAPFSGMIRKGKPPKSSLYEWPFKTRHTPSDSAIVDGVDASDSELINNNANKCMIQGRIQKGRVYVGVSDIAEALGNEYANDGGGLHADNLADGYVLSRENLELTLLKAGDSQADNGAVPYKLRGLTGWIQNAAHSDLPINSMARTPLTNMVGGRATASVVTEDDWRGIMEQISTTTRTTGQVYDVFCTPAMRRAFTNYLFVNPSAASAVPFRQFNTSTKEETGKITLKVSMYETDFGMIRLHTHFSLPSGVHALIVDMTAVRLRPLRNPTKTTVEYRGGGKKTMIEYITGLEVCNPQALGKITVAAAA